MKNHNLKELLVKPYESIKRTIEVMDKAGLGIALITSCENKLLGIVTDGDVRRAIIKNFDLDKEVNTIMNKDYTFLTKNYSNVLVENLFNVKPIKHIPILDENMEVIDLIVYNDFYSRPVKENYALIMAGGLGTRLRPLTYDLPKPMLKVGAKPILETIIDQLKSFGFINIIISVNYKSEIIKEYFKDGSSFGVKISYIEEKKRMGTAGAIKLAKDYLVKDFFVINGDILTKLNFLSFMNHHIEDNNLITVSTRKHDFQVPYGVLDIDGSKVNLIKEKPTYNFFINAGMYCLNPEVINFIPDDEYFDITKLIEILIKNNKLVGSFPIREYWMDIGQVNDYHRANEDYYELFGDINFTNI